MILPMYKMHTLNPSMYVGFIVCKLHQHITRKLHLASNYQYGGPANNVRFPRTIPLRLIT